MVEELTSAALFHCRAKNRQMQVEECLALYVTHNANMNAPQHRYMRRRCCHHCPQGRQVRTDFQTTRYAAARLRG